MKKQLFSMTMLLMIFNLNCIKGFSQNNQLIIGNLDSMYYKTINVSIGFGQPTKTYDLDINNDSIIDFRFHSYDSYISTINLWTEGTYIIPFDSTYFAIETISDSSCDQYNNNIYNYYSYELVKNFNIGDTLNNNYNYTDQTTYLAYRSSHMNWPSCTSDNRDHWPLYMNVYQFIGFIKYIHGVAYKGWIQVKFLNSDELINIKDFAFSYNPNSIIETDYNNSIDIFPNPVNNIINIRGINFNSYSIIKSDGDIICTKNMNDLKNNIIDVSFLNKGIYLLILKNNKSEKLIKFIKY